MIRAVFRRGLTILMKYGTKKSGFYCRLFRQQSTGVIAIAWRGSDELLKDFITADALEIGFGPDSNSIPKFPKGLGGTRKHTELLKAILRTGLLAPGTRWAQRLSKAGMPGQELESSWSRKLRDYIWRSRSRSVNY